MAPRPSHRLRASVARPLIPARDPRSAGPLAPRGRRSAGLLVPRGRRSAELLAPRGKRSARVPRALLTSAGLETFRERVFAWIERIPRGQVATYGQIAVLAGYPRQARRVGQALGRPPWPAGLPWQRVINAQGRVSARAPRADHAIGAREAEQERLLRREGVRFVGGKTDLERYRWRGK